MVRRPAFLRALPNLGPLLWKTSAAAAGGRANRMRGVPAECVRQITPEMLPDGHVFLDCDKSFGSFVKDFAKNGRKCQRGIMQSRFLC